MVSFECKSPGGFDLCLNNGVCTVLTWPERGENNTIVVVTRNESGCACPEGYHYDYLFFHFPSCTLPSNMYLWFLIYYSVACLILILLISRETWFISHGKTRLVAISNVLLLASAWAQVASVYFQDGAFEANAAFACLTFVLAFLMGGKLSVSFMETIAAVRRLPVGRFRNVLRVATVLAVVTTVPCGLIMLAFCRESNSSYNLAAWLMETLLIIWCAFFALTIAYYTTVLLRNIEGASTMKGSAADATRQAIRQLIRKVRFIRNVSLYNGVIILLLGVPKAIIFVVFGSVPYHWIFGYFVLHQNLLFMSLSILVFLRHTNRKKRRDEERHKRDLEKGNNDGRSSAPGEDTQIAGITGTPEKAKYRKELGLQTNGKYGRTWLFRGSSLMTHQNNKDRSKMTVDPQVMQGQLPNHVVPHVVPTVMGDIHADDQ